MASRQRRRSGGRTERQSRGRAAHLGPERRRPLVLDAAREERRPVEAVGEALPRALR